MMFSHQKPRDGVTKQRGNKGKNNKNQEKAGSLDFFLNDTETITINNSDKR